MTPIVISTLEMIPNKWKPSELQYYLDQPEYYEESGKLEETCSRSNSSEKPSDNACRKNSQNNNNNNVTADHRVKLKEFKKRVKYLDLVRELNKTVEPESDDYTNCNWGSWHGYQSIGTRTEGLGNKRTGGDHLHTALLKSVRIQRKVLEIWWDLQSFKLQWKPIS